MLDDLPVLNDGDLSSFRIGVHEHRSFDGGTLGSLRPVVLASPPRFLPRRRTRVG
jgi:hypothetical protein